MGLRVAQWAAVVIVKSDSRCMLFLSPPQGPLCVRGRLGREKKNNARRDDGKGKSDAYPMLFNDLYDY